MNKKIEYSDDPPGDEPIGELIKIEDFLPPPEKLVFKKDTTKVTITLSNSTIAFLNAKRKNITPNIRG